MLRTLYQLAQEERLITDTSFEMKPVAWTILLDINGNLAKGGIISNKELAPPEYDKKGKEKKRKELTKRLLIPRQFVIETGAGRTSGAYAYFLVDKADYVFGFLPNSEIGKAQTDEKLCNRHDLFINDVSSCYEATQSPSIKALLTFLRNVRANGLPIALPDNLVSNDQFAFKVLPNSEDYVHEEDHVVDYWKRMSNPTSQQGAATKMCLVTGKPFTQEALFPSIKRVPGATSSGAGLVSFNAQAFESQGWASSENASISPPASQAIATALNRLMDPAFETQEGKQLPKRFENIAKDTVIAYWPKGFWIKYLDEQQGSFSNLLASSWKGIKPIKDDASEFHAFTLSGSQGRIIVRDHFETTAMRLYENLEFHYESLQIEPLTQTKEGKDPVPRYGTNLLLESTVLDGKRDNISPPQAVQFYQAIHKGENYPFPESLIHNALRRNLAEIHDDSWRSSHRADIRAGLFKAYLIRNHKFTNLTNVMNPTENKFPYLMGRIFSCYGEMQRLANLPRTVNADLTTKNYAKFFARPLATYAVLGEPYRRHYKTALKNKGNKVGGLARRLNTEIEIIQAALSPSDMKETFNTKDQALFTLAFHHQNHWHRQSTESRIAFINGQTLDPFDPALLIAPLKEKESKTELTK
mgnify:CR=1 FL=1